MSPDELEMLQSLLKNTLYAIGLFSIDQYEELVESDRQQIARFENVGAMIDPTTYRGALQSGELEYQKAQVEIMKYILEIRKQIDIMQALTEKYKTSGSIR